MPIDPDKRRTHYGPAWQRLSRAMREEAGRCRCAGICGKVRCRVEGCDGPPETVAHLDHNPGRELAGGRHEDEAPERRARLRVLCAACHMRYDAPHHASRRMDRMRAEATIAAREAGQATLPLMTPRRYQEDILTGLRAPGRHLVVAPTGAGKTAIAAWACRLDGRALWLVPWRPLLGQTREAVERCDAGPWGSRPADGARVTIMTVDAFARDPDPGPWSTVVLDEAHRFETARRVALVEELFADRVIMLTATPWALHRGTVPADVIHVAPSPLDLVRTGVLRAPEIVAAELPRNATRAVAYCETVADADAFAGAREGWEVVSARTSSRTVAERLAAFRAGRLAGLANCGVLIEGFDARVDAIALQRPMTLRQYVQTCGRLMRPHPGPARLFEPEPGAAARWGPPHLLPWPPWAPGDGEPVRVTDRRKRGPGGGRLVDVAAEIGAGPEWLARARRAYYGQGSGAHGPST